MRFIKKNITRDQHSNVVSNKLVRAQENINTMNLFKYIFTLLAIGFGTISFGQTINFTTPGADTWLCPAGVTSVTVTVYGAGGGGGGSSSGADGAGGGGGGGASQSVLVVVPGVTYNLYVGTGGAGSTGLGAGTAGEQSWFNTAGTLQANGGSGGFAQDSDGGQGGNGGTAGTGTTTFNGGNGANGRDHNNGRGGGGGGGAGTTANGGDASGSTTTYSQNGGAGGATGGGAGGDGGSANANGSNGSTIGGGGGGGGDGSTNGGTGARGQVTIVIPLINDACSGAIALTVDAACTVGSTTTATTEGGEVQPCGGAFDQSVWYSFVATSTQHEVTIDNTDQVCYNMYTAIYDGSGGCVPTTPIACISDNADPQVYNYGGFNIGTTYYIQVTFGSGACSDLTFCIDVSTAAACTGESTCGCGTLCIPTDGTCTTGSLNGASNCLSSGCASANPTALFSFLATSATMDVNINNLGTEWVAGDIDVRLYYGGCSVTLQEVQCSAVPSFSYQFIGLTSGTMYSLWISSSNGYNGANSEFGLCVTSAGSSCAVVAGCGYTVGPPGNSYGIYAPDAVSGVVDCEITAIAGTGGEGFLVAQPTDAAYTSVAVSEYPIITAENISCLNSDMDFTTTDATPNWTDLGLNETATLPSTAGTISNNQYSATLGRRNIDFTGDVGGGGTYLNENFNGCSGGAPAGWNINLVTGAGTWDFNLSSFSSFPYANNNDGTCWAQFDDDVLGSGANNQVQLETPAYDISGCTTGSLSFYYRHEDSAGDGLFRVYVWDGTTWVLVFTQTSDASGTEVIDITAYLNTALQVRFDYFDDNGWGWGVGIDDVSITGTGCATTTAVTYTDFVNIIQDKPVAAPILGSNNVCPGSYSFSSPDAGTPGYTYLWTVTDPAGETSVVATSTLSTTNISFTNSTAATVAYTVQLDITSECCGPLTQVTYNVDVNPTPAAPSVVSAALTECEGGSVTMQVSSPNAGYTYDWYDAPTAGTLLGSGTSYTLSPVPNGGGSYYVEATTSDGCISPTRTLVTVTERNTDPTGINNSYCAAGDITVSVVSVAGTVYNWYSLAVGGSLLQSSTSLDYVVNVPGPAPQTVSVWVTATEPGCSESARVQVDASITASSGTTTWTGGTSTNWFDPANWSDCVPNCATDAIFASGAVTNECSIKFSEGTAAGGDGIARVESISIDAARTITWGEAKSILNVCEDFTHNGTITMTSMGSVSFVSTDRQQNYSKGATGSGDFYTLEINNTNATPYVNITGTNDMEVATDGQLTLSNGLIVTGTNNIVINNTTNSSVTGQSISSYVYGTMRRYSNTAVDTFSYPVGNATAYELMDLLVTGSNTTNYIDVYFSTAQDATGSGLPISEPTNGFMSFVDAVNTGGVNATTGDANGGIWTVTSDGGTANYDMTLYGRNYDNAQNTHTILKRVTAGPGAWTIPGTYGFETVAGNLLTVNRTGFSGFSQFTIVYSDDFLSIALLDFTAEKNTDVVDLFWTTASEINNDFFTIERSDDGINFEHVVGTEDGAGNSNSPIHYSMVDKYPIVGLSYYRLKQTDFNGAYTYSKIVPINFNGANNFFQVYPNPILDEIVVTFNEETKEKCELKIYDARSKLVHSEKVDAQTKKVSFDLSKLETGIYFILSEDNQHKIKFVKQ